MATEDFEECPLCLESLELDDIGFFPCSCGYQVCRFCWTRIINGENGLCPACRKPYNSEQPASFNPMTEEEISNLKKQRRKKDQQKKSKISETRKHLSDFRVVQKNLVFVVGIPMWLAGEKELLKGPDYFGKYGQIFKIVINKNTTFAGPNGQQSVSAYVTYCRTEDAMKSIMELKKNDIDNRPLKVSLGTTKYCSQFLRGAACTKHECMYLHELGEEEASFTKEDMQLGKHTEYESRLVQDYLTSCEQKSTQRAHSESSTVGSRKPAATPTVVVPPVVPNTRRKRNSSSSSNSNPSGRGDVDCDNNVVTTSSSTCNKVPTPALSASYPTQRNPVRVQQGSVSHERHPPQPAASHPIHRSAPTCLILATSGENLDRPTSNRSTVTPHNHLPSNTDINHTVAGPTIQPPITSVAVSRDVGQQVPPPTVASSSSSVPTNGFVLPHKNSNALFMDAVQNGLLQSKSLAPEKLPPGLIYQPMRHPSGSSEDAAALDFDPIRESQAGLAEMMEFENQFRTHVNLNQQQHHHQQQQQQQLQHQQQQFAAFQFQENFQALASMLTPDNPQPHQSTQQAKSTPPPPGFELLTMPPGMSNHPLHGLLPPNTSGMYQPPPDFSQQSQQQQRHHHQQLEQLWQQPAPPAEANPIKDLHHTLRSLLPHANISFGSPGQLNALNNGSRGTNNDGQNTVTDNASHWSIDDPAILVSGQLASSPSLVEDMWRNSRVPAPSQQETPAPMNFWRSMPPGIDMMGSHNRPFYPNQGQHQDTQHATVQRNQSGNMY